MAKQQPRSRPMAPADRRRTILDVAIPLLIEKGVATTTAEIAQAAGIAEGTIFRVFADKPTLIFEAVKATMDPGPLADAIRAIDSAQAFKIQLAEAACVLLGNFARVIALAELLRSMPTAHRSRQGDVRILIAESSAVISAALADLFERHRKVLRVPPSTAIGSFRGLIFASGHPLLPPEERLTVDEIVSILLAGIARPGRR